MDQFPPIAVNRYRDARGGSLRPEDVGRRVRLAGWVAAKRDHGGLLFVDMRDPGAGSGGGGLVQLVGHPDRPAFEVLTHLRVESVISVSGEVVARPPETVNPKLDTGAVEVVVEDLEVLSASEVLPFPVEKDTEVGEESRLRYRYLDMRRGLWSSAWRPGPGWARWCGTTWVPAVFSRYRRRC